MQLEAHKTELEFKTPLGVVRCGFTCSGKINFSKRNKYLNGNSEIYLTDGHRIEIISFKIDGPLLRGDTLNDSFGRIFRIEKTNDYEETIETYCLLYQSNETITFDIATGEHLDAIQANDDEWILHIGTEDGEVLNNRAKINNWFPSRLENKSDYYQYITELSKNGFVTKNPKLILGEKIHIHYLCAYDKRDDEKVNTWLAVDQFKNNLEKWIGIE